MGATAAGGTPYPTFDKGRNSGWYKDYLLHHASGRKIAFAAADQQKMYTQMYNAMNLRISGQNLSAPRHMAALELTASGATYEETQ